MRKCMILLIYRYTDWIQHKITTNTNLIIGNKKNNSTKKDQGSLMKNAFFNQLQQLSIRN